jgi:membrane protease YdiL (CAAX protease family)
VSSGLFGLWHVLPATGSSGAVSGAVSGALGSSGAVVGTVLFTAVAGVVFRAWQRWSGHLVTPMLLHAATNSLAALLAWWVTHRPHP